MKLTAWLAVATVIPSSLFSAVFAASPAVRRQDISQSDSIAPTTTAAPEGGSATHLRSVTAVLLNTTTPVPSADASTTSLSPYSPNRRNGTVPAGEIPLVPRQSPGLIFAGIALILSGLAYGIFSAIQLRVYAFFSVAFPVALSFTCLFVYISDDGISPGKEVGFVVGTFFIAVAFGGFAGWFFDELGNYLGPCMAGFCFSMWLLTQRDGGLIQSKIGVIIFMLALLLIPGPLGYWPRIVRYAMMVFVPFTAATALVLGVDCLTRVGLKEFWIYIWQINPNLFPLNTRTYPVTKSMRVESAAIIAGTIAFFLVYWKLWQKQRVKEIARKEEQRQVDDDLDREERETGQKVLMQVNEDMNSWEKQYNPTEETLGSHSSLAPSGGSGKRVSDMDAIEKKNASRLSQSTLLASGTLGAGSSKDHLADGISLVDEACEPSSRDGIPGASKDVQESELSEDQNPAPEFVPLPGVLAYKPRGSEYNEPTTDLPSEDNLSDILNFADDHSSAVNPVLDSASERSVSGPLSAFHSQLSLPPGEGSTGAHTRNSSLNQLENIAKKDSGAVSKERLGSATPGEDFLTTITFSPADGDENVTDGSAERPLSISSRRLTRESLADRSSVNLRASKSYKTHEWIKRASEAEEPKVEEVSWEVPGRAPSPTTQIVNRQSGIFQDQAASGISPLMNTEGPSSKSFSKRNSVDPEALSRLGGDFRHLPIASGNEISRGSTPSNDTPRSGQSAATGPEEDGPDRVRAGVQKTIGFAPDPSSTLMGQRQKRLQETKEAIATMNIEIAQRAAAARLSAIGSTVGPVAEEDSDDDVPLAQRRASLLARQMSSGGAGTPKAPASAPLSRQNSGLVGSGLLNARSSSQNLLENWASTAMGSRRNSSTQPLDARASQQNLLGNTASPPVPPYNPARLSQQNLALDTHQPSRERDRSRRSSNQAALYSQWRQSLQSLSPASEQHTTQHFQSERREQMINDMRRQQTQQHQNQWYQQQVNEYVTRTLRTPSGHAIHSQALDRMQQEANRKTGQGGKGGGKSGQ